MTLYEFEIILKRKAEKAKELGNAYCSFAKKNPNHRDAQAQRGAGLALLDMAIILESE